MQSAHILGAGLCLLFAVGMILWVICKRTLGTRQATFPADAEQSAPPDDFRSIYEDHPLSMWIYDPDSKRFLSANNAACASYGYPEEELLTMCVGQLAPPVDASTPSEDEGEGVSGDAVKDGSRLQHVRKDGSSLAAEVSERDITFRGAPARLVLAIDVTEREKLNSELSRRAQHDPLTGLANRLLLDERIEQCLERSLREQKKAVLFTIDADRFKLVNDTYGHLTGDEALKAIAQRLRSRIRSVDTLARTGGEEFAAIIGGLHNVEDAEKVAAMFVRLFDLPVSLPDRELKLSISVGAAIFPDDANDGKSLREKSDQALYHAKRSGRNRYEFASREVCSPFDQALSIESALREALRDEAFNLNFQPVFAGDGGLAYFETLLRMPEQNSAAYGPSQFIPVAEESGLILPVGEWVLTKALEQLQRWHHQGMEHLGIAVNVSGKQLLHKGFVPFVLDALEKHGLPPSSLQLEVNETSLMSESALLRDSMVRLAGRGVRFAIDDFGTGCSSLERLVDLPISVMKIDRCFIGRMDKGQRADDIVTAIIQMAQRLRIEVVADGVENETQLTLLLRRGCNLFQGFHLSRPMSAEEATRHLEQLSVAGEWMDGPSSLSSGEQEGTSSGGSLHLLGNRVPEDEAAGHPACHRKTASARASRRENQLPTLAGSGRT